ncbi:heavy metal translocating P-type ATPase [Streptomonospora nanhaiensis]|uniref:heavy metal translocating P-type ATPase n=1 Tax=Streptomonospora nanhaiensis TaxID=1323731 RepID=UPI001C38EED8|nr:heavy metal translocating P-type ATPase [Streptomonospora nanhaiensis]MBV2364145.1 heavy metal translocating P-type ATPase [Streptomonospora nanhaiensis]
MSAPRPRTVLTGASAAGLAAGALLHVAGASAEGDAVWVAVAAAGAVAAAWWVVEGLRRGRFGTDVIALFALAGTIAVGEALAGAVIAVMLTGGRLLEDRASRRAHADLGALLERAPTTARVERGGSLVTVAAEEVRVGDLVVVANGETVPVDGRLEDGSAVLDEAAVTGEPLPVERHTDDALTSGVVNAGPAFRLRATTEARDSTYAAIIALVREAEAGSAPFVRMADRYAAVFLPITVVLAAASWLLSGDPVRAVAVLVVATPCPLILAAPIAFTSGMSRSARRGVIVKGGDALERLARARTLLFDKTGTVTAGSPRLTGIATVEGVGVEEALTAAASLDQFSPHTLAAAIVRAARERGLSPAMPADVVEVPGSGIAGRVGEVRVRVGKAAWAAPDPPREWVAHVRARAQHEDAVTVFVGLGGRMAGALLLHDPLRPDAPRTFRLLRQAGIDRMVMATGDRAPAAAVIGDYVGADQVHAEQSPQAKAELARAENSRAPTVMVGDGVNDAPALACAGVGVALGARGATASSQAADIVIAVDRLARLADVLAIARRTRLIARQSAFAGMGLSLAAMVAAALGYLPPVAGAVFQEVVDVAVILNALRALASGGWRRPPALRREEADLVRRLDAEHRALWPRIERLPQAADSVVRLPPGRLGPVAEELADFLDDLVRHERTDERKLYPAVDRALRTSEATATMSRAHAEINAAARRVQELLPRLADTGTDEERHRAAELLLGLHALLRLHFAQEEENYHALATALESGGDAGEDGTGPPEGPGGGVPRPRRGPGGPSRLRHRRRMEAGGG